MTSSESNAERSGGLMGALKDSPAVSALGGAARDYAKAKGGDAVKKVGAKLTGATENLHNTADEGGFTSTAARSAMQKVAQGDNPVKAAVKGVGSGIAEKVKSAFGGGGGGGKQKVISLIEDIHIGVPVDVAYNQWTQFQEFASFMKGVESVDQTDEVESNWKVKVFKSRRTFKSSITEQVPDRRIAWTSEGAKGSTKGVVTFHPLADDLTQVLLVLEYYPQGLFEKTGNIWRAGGRRARLDLKHFRRFVMMRGEETGSWRGEIRDGEVVREPDEEEPDQEGAEDEATSEGEPAEDEDEEYDQDEEEEEPAEEEEEPAEGEDESDDNEEPEEEPEEEPAEEQRGNGRRRRRQPARAR